MQLIKDVIQQEIEELQKLRNREQLNLEKAIHEILNVNGKLIVSGMGKSGLIGRKISATLASLGTESFFLHPGEAYHGDLGMIGKGDAVLAISNSGETEELLKLIPFIKEQKNLLISMTGKSQSTLAKNSDFHINVGVDEEACHHQLAPTSSTTNALVMGDAIAIALSQARNFQPEDFAKFHPGGSLGKKLLAKVADYMTDKNLPVCNKKTHIIEAISIMSSGRKGIIIVTEGDKIEGVITDGDIRRAMELQQSDFFELSAVDIMSTDPKTIDIKAKLIEAEKTFNNYKITSLLVTENTSLKGIIQIYDI